MNDQGDTVNTWSHYNNNNSLYIYIYIWNEGMCMTYEYTKKDLVIEVDY